MGPFSYLLKEQRIAARQVGENAQRIRQELAATNAALEAAKAENAALNAQILVLTENGAFLEDCIAEMAAQVYA